MRRIESLEQDKNSKERLTESTKLDPWGSQRLNHQPKSKHGLDLGPRTYVVDKKLCFHAGSQHLEQGLSEHVCLPACGSCALNGPSCMASVGEDTCTTIAT